MGDEKVVLPPWMRTPQTDAHSIPNKPALCIDTHSPPLIASMIAMAVGGQINLRASNPAAANIGALLHPPLIKLISEYAARFTAHVSSVKRVLSRPMFVSLASNTGTGTGADTPSEAEECAIIGRVV